MNLILSVFVLSCVAGALAAGYGGYGGGYGGHGGYGGYGYGRYHSGSEAAVDGVNAYRQKKVNSVARHYGSGVGTADYDGVPGTPYGRTGYGYRGYGHGGYRGGYGGGYGGYGGGYGRGYGY